MQAGAAFSLSEAMGLADRPISILCLGETLVDLVCERAVSDPLEADHFVPHPGGALANVAVGARRAGASVALLSGVGDDPWGEWLRRRIAGEGVDTRFLASVGGSSTPVAFIRFGPDREPAYAVYGAGIEEAMAGLGMHLEAALPLSEALVFGSNTLVGKEGRELTLRARHAALEREMPVLFDPNLRPNRWRDLGLALERCRELIPDSLVVRANRTEARQLTGEADPAEAAEALVELGARLAIVTLGADGALMRGAASARRPSPRVEVVAPLGAGDAFMGALAAALGQCGWDLSGAEDALEAALDAGARACTSWGAQG